MGRAARPPRCSESTEAPTGRPHRWMVTERDPRKGPGNRIPPTDRLTDTTGQQASGCDSDSDVDEPDPHDIGTSAPAGDDAEALEERHRSGPPHRARPSWSAVPGCRRCRRRPRRSRWTPGRTRSSGRPCHPPRSDPRRRTASVPERVTHTSGPPRARVDGRDDRSVITAVHTTGESLAGADRPRARRRRRTAATARQSSASSIRFRGRTSHRPEVDAPACHGHTGLCSCCATAGGHMRHGTDTSAR